MLIKELAIERSDWIDCSNEMLETKTSTSLQVATVEGLADLATDRKKWEKKTALKSSTA